MTQLSPNALQGEKIAVLVANGFNEQDLTYAQKIVQGCGGYIRVISMDSGLVNSWNGGSWGLNFAADGMLNEALAVDFSMLMIPGGRRSVDKLKLTAHTRRFINGFLTADKPLAMIDESVEILSHFGMMEGYALSAPAEMESDIIMAGGTYSADAYTIDRNLMTGSAGEGEGAYEAFIEAVVSHFAPEQAMDQAA